MDSAKDIVQDAYLKVLESNNEFKGASSLKTYLYRIVINKCIDAKKAKGAMSSLVDLFTKENIQSSQDAFEKAEDKALIRKLLNAVPQKFRVPLILAEVEGMSYAEIADILKLSLNTIRTRIFRCRRKLRKDLEKAGYYHETCGPYGLLISRYIDNDLEHNESCLLQRHLNTCGACRTTLDNYVKMKKLVCTSFLPAEVFAVASRAGKPMTALASACAGTSGWRRFLLWRPPLSPVFRPIV